MTAATRSLFFSDTLKKDTAQTFRVFLSFLSEPSAVFGSVSSLDGPALASEVSCPVSSVDGPDLASEVSCPVSSVDGPFSEPLALSGPVSSLDGPALASTSTSGSVAAALPLSCPVSLLPSWTKVALRCLHS